MRVAHCIQDLAKDVWLEQEIKKSTAKVIIFYSVPSRLSVMTDYWESQACGVWVFCSISPWNVYAAGMCLYAFIPISYLFALKNLYSEWKFLKKKNILSIFFKLKEFHLVDANIILLFIQNKLC